MNETIKATTKRMDVLPLVKHYLSELGLYELIDRHIPQRSNEQMAPAQVISMMVMNIICASRPLYRFSEWLADYLDGMAQEQRNASKYNDDRLGRCLDKLFNTDRNSIMTELSANAIKTHNLETRDIHNDSTSVTFTGEYDEQESGAIKLARGFNKDHRPDCKQIVFGLNITSDGNVPLSFDLFDGNQTDDKTHVPNWEGLRELLSKEDFFYIADCKLCSMENMDHIHGNGGKFITIVPKNRKEVKSFRKYVQSNDVDWQDAMVVEDSRKKGRFVTYRTFEQTKCLNEYRVIWVHSSSKERQDKSRREHAIQTVEQALTGLSKKINKHKLKTKEQIEAAIKKACKGKASLFDINLIEEEHSIRKQTTPGRPGPNTVYQKVEVVTFRLEHTINEEAVLKAGLMDGTFPLITNSSIVAAEVLKKYKNQPYLEKRMYTAKSILKVAPVFLKTPKRIEAMLFLYFIALMVVGLIERNIRMNMKQANIEKLPILPSKMKTGTPTWNNLSNFFRNVHLSIISRHKTILSSSVNGVTDLHGQVLQLLGIPERVYLDLKDKWWQFKPA
ncbi:MAG: IS1634 family transposase [Cytophagales bacterium]|nr:IS1634 family transposase [Cytophagales bacterium]